MSNIMTEENPPLTIVPHRVLLSFQQSHFASDEKNMTHTTQYGTTVIVHNVQTLLLHLCYEHIYVLLPPYTLVNVSFL